MYKIIESPIINNNIISSNQPNHTNRPKYQRYSSVDQSYNSKNQWSQNSSRTLQINENRINNSGQKTSRVQKQRVHSQKKLTLTTANPTNSINNINATYTPINNNHNSPIINAREAFEGFKKNLQLNTNNFNKTTPLEKKGKFCSMKNSQAIKFPTSTTNIRYDSNPLIDQKQNQNDLIQKFSYQAQKQRSRALLEVNKINFQQNQTNPENLYKHSQPFYTAPTSPVYTNQKINIDTPYIHKPNNSALQRPENKFILDLVNERISSLKQQTNKIIFQNSMKIKQLQSLLLQNKEQIMNKNQKIRQLQIQILLKQQTNSRKTQLRSQTSINMNYNKKLSSDITAQNNHYLLSRLNDVQKKLQVLTKFTTDEQLNIKLDNLNSYLSSFVQVKFHNLKFTLKAFITKNQQKIVQIADKIDRVDKIIKIDHIESYQKLLEKTKDICKNLESFYSINQNVGMNIYKNEFRQNNDDMKNTMNTFNSSFKNKTTQESFHNMLQSRDANDSFWQNMEDYSLHQSAKLQEPSFTDDSFSYAGGMINNKINSNSNSSCHQFALGSFPSFSKFSIDANTNGRASNLTNLNNLYSCKQSLQISEKYINQNKNSLMKLSSSIQTLQQISKYRNGPVNAYIDVNGYIRYRGSQSCIFDKKGNILKPSKAEIQYCLTKHLITIQ